MAFNRKEYRHQYYLAHREQEKEYSRQYDSKHKRDWTQYRRDHKTELSEYAKQYYKQHQHQYIQNHKEYRQRIKLEVLDHYSTNKGMTNPDGSLIKTPCCGLCQESDLAKLNIDHIAGKGRAHRKSVLGRDGGGGLPFYLWLRRNNYPFGYQTLCEDCNDKKKVWEGECRRKKSTVQ